MVMVGSWMSGLLDGERVILMLWAVSQLSRLALRAPITKPAVCEGMVISIVCVWLWLGGVGLGGAFAVICGSVSVWVGGLGLLGVGISKFFM